MGNAVDDVIHIARGTLNSVASSIDLKPTLVRAIWCVLDGNRAIAPTDAERVSANPVDCETIASFDTMPIVTDPTVTQNQEPVHGSGQHRHTGTDRRLYSESIDETDVDIC
jgi:hypothetical protein